MKKWIKIPLVIIGVLLTLWFIGKATRTFTLMTMSADANFPTLKYGDKFFISKLVKPRRFRLISYVSNTEYFGKQIWVHRLCGLEGDTIEIRNGDLYINGQYSDKELGLAHPYKIPRAELPAVEQLHTLNEISTYTIGSDTIVTNLSDALVRRNQLKVFRVVLPASHRDNDIEKIFKQPWNADHFGPLVIPKGKYFLLGDNRNNSMDSRYIGFIDKSDFVATVLWK